VSWHGAERIIVLSIWHDDLCAATFRLPVGDAGRMIVAISDAMSRAINPPNRAIQSTQLPRWRSNLLRARELLHNRVGEKRRTPPATGLRVIRIRDASTSVDRDEPPAD